MEVINKNYSHFTAVKKRSRESESAWWMNIVFFVLKIKIYKDVDVDINGIGCNRRFS